MLWWSSFLFSVPPLIPPILPSLLSLPFPSYPLSVSLLWLFSLPLSALYHTFSSSLPNIFSSSLCPLFWYLFILPNSITYYLFDVPHVFSFFSKFILFPISPPISLLPMSPVSSNYLLMYGTDLFLSYIISPCLSFLVFVLWKPSYFLAYVSFPSIYSVFDCFLFIVSTFLPPRPFLPCSIYCFPSYLILLPELLPSDNSHTIPIYSRYPSRPQWL